jgi:hypothetical protein
MVKTMPHILPFGQPIFRVSRRRPHGDSIIDPTIGKVVWERMSPATIQKNSYAVRMMSRGAWPKGIARHRWHRWLWTTGWASEGQDGDYASVLILPAHLVYLTDGGDPIFARQEAAAFAVERRYHISDSETWTVPVLLGKDALVRDAAALIRLRPDR